MLGTELKDALLAQKQAAKVGFDWPTALGTLEKVKEEALELELELKRPVLSKECVEEELGDLLFSVINTARKLKINPGNALGCATTKFLRRFHAASELAKTDGILFSNAPLADLESIWDRVKAAEKNCIDKTG
jgi:uncharacterized protein YabN with tetrapyrrole methylase and pyrophosphatase domain